MTNKESPVSAEDLLPCPFCHCAMHIESTRNWYKVIGAHDGCPFDTGEPTMIYRKTDCTERSLIEKWNRRYTAASGVKVPSFIVREAERAIHEATHPSGMRTNGPATARIEVSKLAALLRYATATPPVAKESLTTDMSTPATHQDNVSTESVNVDMSDQKAEQADAIHAIQELIESHKRDVGGECDESCDIVAGMEAALGAICALPAKAERIPDTGKMVKSVAAGLDDERILREAIGTAGHANPEHDEYAFTGVELIAFVRTLLAQPGAESKDAAKEREGGRQ